MRPPRIIDAHHHLWDLGRIHYPWLTDAIVPDFLFGDYARIRKNYLPQDMRRQMQGWNVEMTVHVEAERADEEQVRETEWLSEMHERFRLPNAIIGHVWLADPQVEERLRQHMRYALFRGVRSKPRTGKTAREANPVGPATMSDPQWRRGLKLLERLGLIYDFRVPYYHLKEGAELAGLCPSLQFIVNHAGLPRDRSPEGLAIWRDGMKALAAHANVAVKISGISLPGMPWTVATQGAVILETIDMFGIDRCMFASNFPPDNCVTEYAPMMQAFETVMARFSEDERDRFFYANAKRFYRPVP
ncbi:MAG TPA: amidohydrolase family protein [Hyphomicrobiaceae bacterium]|jgi:predicted TIM-barrel fold metal-dependent hydrolase|nr:amidohydrolase family protein [Hyphomicrobiaceae bacterium]